MICVIFYSMPGKIVGQVLKLSKNAHILHKYIHMLTYIKRTKNQQTNVLKYVRE